MAKGKSSVETQVEKIFRCNNQGSFATQHKYKEDAYRFARYCAEIFKLQNLKNVSDKHVIAYTQHRLNQGLSAKTVKNDLAAIRFMHNQLAQTRYEISTNRELQEKGEFKIPETPQVKGDRAWTTQEYNSFVQFSLEKGNQDAADIAILARHNGLRITEAVAIRRSQAEKALRTNVYHVGHEAKGGRERDVPLSLPAREVLKRRLVTTPRGQRLFIPEKDKTHLVRDRMENFLNSHRDKFTTAEGQELRTWKETGATNKMTWHGLRYLYVQGRMDELISAGATWVEAASEVSLDVGHNRIDVIQIYTAGK